MFSVRAMLRKWRNRSPAFTSPVERYILEPDDNEVFADYSRWHPKKNTDAADDNDGLFASQRLGKNIFLPVVRPSFKIDKQDKLFAMGSCFARGIELALKDRGFAMESAATEFDHFETTGDRRLNPLGFTNKYTTFSMLNELRWALDPDATFPEESLVDLDDGICIDPHINPTLKPVDRAGTVERRHIMTDVVRRIAHCRIVFLTLGLVEAWYDKKAGVWLNSTPTPAMRRKHPQRYEFSVTGYPENLQNLENFHDLLTKFGHPDVHIIVTVSPVPLNATFSGQDVVVANTYSKSTLRAVASEWAKRHDNVEYFPSYEIVINSDRGLAWEDDKRHVRGRMAWRIMDYFVRAYVG